MKLYKDKDGNVFAYELDGSQDHLIEDKTPATQADVDAINKARNDAIEAEIEAAKAIKESALAKLAALGLTEDEVKALVG
jgi:ethanolamine utilization cobalamin adenosyltransferase